MNAEQYQKLIEEAIAEDAERDAKINKLMKATSDLIHVTEAILGMVAMMNNTDKSLIDTVSVLQRSVRELQDQAQVPDAG